MGEITMDTMDLYDSRTNVRLRRIMGFVTLSELVEGTDLDTDETSLRRLVRIGDSHSVDVSPPGPIRVGDLAILHLSVNVAEADKERYADGYQILQDDKVVDRGRVSYCDWRNE
jgi:hypothetical protein